MTKAINYNSKTTTDHNVISPVVTGQESMTSNRLLPAFDRNIFNFSTLDPTQSVYMQLELLACSVTEGTVCGGCSNHDRLQRVGLNVLKFESDSVHTHKVNAHM